ncbi:MAG: site-specific integrase [Phycisphaerae bacterium]|nr:site-specific integrase [Phycisphaerae bacterium]
MRALLSDGKSARTANFARQIIVAFGSWMVKTGRADTNQFRSVQTLDERKDRRRRRRALTPEELARLLDVARSRGREAWYLAAALAGLRRGDLMRLRWADVDFDNATIVIRTGKAKREDFLPLHPQLAEALKDLREANRALPATKVFPVAVTSRTVLFDFHRAGLAKWESIEGREDADGNPIQRLTTRDAAGTFVDLHALRTTLGTMLARSGVAPQVTKQIMRHADSRTTDKHYVALRLTDAADALLALPKIALSATSVLATGTDDASAVVANHESETRNTSRNSRAESGTTAHMGAQDQPKQGGRRSRSNPPNSAALRTSAHNVARKRETGLEPATFSLGS